MVKFYKTDIFIKCEWIPVKLTKHYFSIYDQEKYINIQNNKCIFKKDSCIENCPLMNDLKKINIRSSDYELLMLFRILMNIFYSDIGKKVLLFCIF